MLIENHIKSIFDLAMEIRDSKDRNIKELHGYRMSLVFGEGNDEEAKVGLVYTERQISNKYFVCSDESRNNLIQIKDIAQFEKAFAEIMNLLDFIRHPCCSEAKKDILNGNLVWRQIRNVPAWIAMVKPTKKCFWCERDLPQLDKIVLCEEYSHASRFAVIAGL